MILLPISLAGSKRAGDRGAMATTSTSSARKIADAGNTQVPTFNLLDENVKLYGNSTRRLPNLRDCKNAGKESPPACSTLRNKATRCVTSHSHPGG